MKLSSFLGLDACALDECRAASWIVTGATPLDESLTEGTEVAVEIWKRLKQLNPAISLELSIEVLLAW